MRVGHRRRKFKNQAPGPGSRARPGVQGPGPGAPGPGPGLGAPDPGHSLAPPLQSDRIVRMIDKVARPWRPGPRAPGPGPRAPGPGPRARTQGCQGALTKPYPTLLCDRTVRLHWWRSSSTSQGCPPSSGPGPRAPGPSPGPQAQGPGPKPRAPGPGPGPGPRALGPGAAGHPGPKPALVLALIVRKAMAMARRKKLAVKRTPRCTKPKLEGRWCAQCAVWKQRDAFSVFAFHHSHVCKQCAATNREANVATFTSPAQQQLNINRRWFLRSGTKAVTRGWALRCCNNYLQRGIIRVYSWLCTLNQNGSGRQRCHISDQTPMTKSYLTMARHAQSDKEIPSQTHCQIRFRNRF